MARLNINLVPEFQDNLQKIMRLRGIASKSEVVRLAVKEAVKRETTKKLDPTLSSSIAAPIVASASTRRPELDSRSTSIKTPPT